MNTREISQLQDWDEQELQELVVRYVRTFRRLPSHRQLVRFRRARAHLALRLPVQRRPLGVAGAAPWARRPDPLRTTG